MSRDCVSHMINMKNDPQAGIVEEIMIILARLIE